MLDFDFSVEHVLMFMIVIFLLYHLVNNCGCMKDGFSVGGQSTNYTCTKYGDNDAPYNCGDDGILKYNANKILCPQNDKGISICNYDTCCDDIPINCDEALLQYCPFDGNINDQHSCIICAGKNQEKLHNLPKSKNNWRCTHKNILDYCEPLPEYSGTFSVGWYQSGNILPNRCNGSINCPQGSTLIEKTTDGCTQIKWPLYKSERTICKLKDGALPTDEVIDVRELNLGNTTTFYLLNMSYCALDPESSGPESDCYNKDDSCEVGCSPKVHNNDGFICKNITNMGKKQGNGEWYQYSDSNISGKGTKIGPKDPILDVLNMLFCSFNISRIGVDKKGKNDYTIEFKTDNANGGKGKHYNYTFIDNTGDNYDISTSYYSGVNRSLNYSSESPQINYIIRSS